MRIIHLIIGTASAPLRYRTRCGLSVPRDRGDYAYSQQDLETRISCPRCGGVSQSVPKQDTSA